MKASELRELTQEQLDDRLRELREELFNLRFQYATRQLTNTARIKEVRRDIARVLTRQHEVALVGAGSRVMAGAVATRAAAPHQDGARRQQQDAEDGRRGRGVDARAPAIRAQRPPTTKFKAHDEENRCQVGDVVVIAESRPISKEKRWVVREIVKETIGRAWR